MRFEGIMLKAKILSVGFIRVILVVIFAAAAIVAFKSLMHEFEATDFARKLAVKGAELETLAASLDAARGRYISTGQSTYLETCRRDEAMLGKDLAQLKQKVGSDSRQLGLVAEIANAANEWKNQLVEPAIRNGQRIEGKPAQDAGAATSRDLETSKQFERLQAALKSFRSAQDAIAQDRRARADKIVWYAQIFLVAGTIVIAIVSVSISSLVVDAITQPVGKAAALAEAITRGDLSGRIELKGRDEIARLGMALDHMTQDLRTQTLQTLEAVDVLSGASAEITSTATQLSEGASRTSSALADTTATVEEVKQAAKVSSHQAKSVAEISLQAVEVSQAGLKATTETVQKMNQIKDQMHSIGENVVRLSDHSRAIENIIGSVQDIAEQSNLLAVNASIEAARAGDQGKGFAVVAVEIKELADQSRAATDQVRSILEDTKKWVSALVMATEQGIKAVDAGVEQSSRAGESIDALARTVDSSAQSAALIDASAGQQFIGVERVAAAIASMEKALSQHLVGTTELEAAARRLEELGAALRRLVQRYRI